MGLFIALSWKLCIIIECWVSENSCQECIIFRETTFSQNFLSNTTQKKNAEQTPVGEEGGMMLVAEVYVLHWSTYSLMAVYP